MEIPEYIRFDFLLVVLGALSFYFSMTLESKYVEFFEKKELLTKKVKKSIQKI